MSLLVTCKDVEETDLNINDDEDDEEEQWILLSEAEVRVCTWTLEHGSTAARLLMRPEIIVDNPLLR